GAEDAGAVHGDVEAAEEVLRRGDIGDDAGLVGDVGPEVADVGLAEFGDGGRALVVVDIEQGGLAAVGDQVTGHGQAEAGNAAGDHGAGGCELHGNSCGPKTAILPDADGTAGTSAAGAVPLAAQ